MPSTLLSLNGSHTDMIFNLYYSSVICQINNFIFLLFVGYHAAPLFLSSEIKRGVVVSFWLNNLQLISITSR